ncbi:MAG: NAD(P)H-hydrate dehydratase [Ignavibacteriae bacterium]|nr:NAD(P)H-hydrate dehydratase [Ignavibacteriota bacterium]
MIPLYSSDQVRAADNYAIEKLNIPGIVLMENAAVNIKDAILNEFHSLSKKSTFGIICGKGNNGGDGFALARQLLINGFDVKIISLAKEEELKGDALTNFVITQNLILDYPKSKFIFFQSIKNLNSLKNCDVIIDAILGTGVDGEPREPIKSIIKRINKLKAKKVAIDLPTGLNINNAAGNIIFQADLTVTLAEFKNGLFYAKGKANSGKIVKGSIGIGESYFENLNVKEYLIEPEDALAGLPKKGKNIQKYSAGKVLVIAGSGTMPGAAIFASNSASISGAGAGFLAFPKSVKSVPQKKLNSSIVLAYKDNSKEYLSTNNLDELKDKIKWADSIAIGPGLGREEETQQAVFDIMKSFPQKKIVVDADAIYALGNSKYTKLDLRNKIFTPHHKEFADLVGVDIRMLEPNLFFLGRKFVLEMETYLVLKGSPTLIFNPKGEVFINSTGNPGMAKFGTGDVLTGIITSFIAQNKEIENSVISAVYLHSLAADLLVKKNTEFGLTPEKICKNINKAITFLRKSIV